MTENMENMEVNEAAVEEKKVDEPKTYTQAEVDNIVKSRLAREKSKNKSLKAENDRLDKDEPEKITEGADFVPESETTDMELSQPNKPLAQEDLSNMVIEDRKWFEETVGGDFEKFLRSEEFNDFMDGTGLSVRNGIKKFVKLKGKDAVKVAFAKEEAGTKAPVSAGSVKDSGASNLKEYYSPEDVDNLSTKDMDDPEIFERIRQSMTKWK